MISLVQAQQAATNGEAVCRLKLSGEGLSAETLKKLTPAEKVKAQLQRRVTLELNRAKLEPFAGEIAKQLGINVILDKKSFEEAAFDLGTPIEKVISEPIELRLALRLVLDDLALSYVLDKDVLLLTTKTSQENRQIVKYYQVGDFIRAVGSSPTHDNADYDSLIQLIQATIQPTTWKANGGQGDITPFEFLDLLVVSDTQEVHEQLEELFAELRKAHAAKAENVAANETSMKRVVYPIVLPRPLQTKTTRDKDNKETVEVTPVGEPRFTMEELSAQLKKTVEPMSWDDERVSIAVLGEKLIVTHSQATHRKVSEFLHELEVFPWQQPGPNNNRNSPHRGLGNVGGSGSGCGEPGSTRSGGLF